MKHLKIVFLVLFPVSLFAQKKPLDHTVYDQWQSIGERVISNDGRWVAYTITPQEGDADLYIQSADGKTFTKKISRGYNVVITEDSKYAIFKIKPLYKETREARIKKKKAEDMPKDSLGIVTLGKEEWLKLPKVKSFKTPEKGFGWIAYQKEKDAVPSRSNTISPKTIDSLKRTIDSLMQLVTQVKNTRAGNGDEVDADDDPATGSGNTEGSDLVLRDLAGKKDKVFKNVTDYLFNERGTRLLLEISKTKEPGSKNAVLLYDLKKLTLVTLLAGGNDFRNFALSEDGHKIAFAAERDTNSKALQKFYSIYYYQSGDDSAHLLVDKKSPGMQLGMTVSENASISFSKSGKRLLFGTSYLQPPKDTSLIDIDLVKVDIWNYKDDYLQTQQLFQLPSETKRSYQAVYDFANDRILQVGYRELPTVIPTDEGDGKWFFAITDTGRRVESQWSGATRKDVYAVDLRSGKRTLVKKNHDGQIYPSSTGAYVVLYDNKAKNYFTWNGTKLINSTAAIKFPLYNEDNDTPDDPGPYGVMGWQKGDSAVFIYDRYDVWKVDPIGSSAPQLVTSGRKSKTIYRYIRLNPEERFITGSQKLFFRTLNTNDKYSGIAYKEGIQMTGVTGIVTEIGAFNYPALAKAKDQDCFVFVKENYKESPAIYYTKMEAPASGQSNVAPTLLQATNPQQADYNWGTAELYHWKAFDGKAATGILYKPENFDSSKKYPMLIYFYEKLSDGVYSYIAPAPTPSRLNIPFFVSRGYLVFAPDISYTKGHPGKDAYNYIVSGAQSLARKRWVDGKNIGLQGQSWGGYQVAYLVTATHMFKAAWAGAPVVNMFSAYGGIRWESGNNRQFQYEKGQSRIGATPWDRPDLYIENSPFFHLKNVTTPLVIMSNDADGAVPWYQGIEFFTAMRRLNKKVWLLNYNGEAHNLVERRNRKDIQIREQQYFDWLLKGEKAPRWIEEGVPAVKKGRDWGLELIDNEE
ncbi:MAG TPA: prolyl oligopeptidase family serine peptidase [Flavisolibacter sp.]|jgi:dipeptidyl aminopeptidase/acylaminoacyl peptidase|nr:prolyl oligopeptidase family serine peptidase [Flavisolibacter sp.]